MNDKNVKEKTQILKSTKVKIALVMLALVAGFIIRGKLEETHKTQLEEEAEEDVMSKRADYAEPVGKDNKILQAFLAQCPCAACRRAVWDVGDGTQSRRGRDRRRLYQ